jgi:transposase-like protein
MTERKRDLTREERITAAYLHFVRGNEVQDLAVAFDVNLGRVSEACAAIALAASDPKGIRRLVEAIAEPKEPNQ